ncbi:AraC family transcriptional regulator [Pseudanabaena minima]|uniref:AraC family transcriptional regulator n=1 Tax=Pseudanabaena minima TaxID=890415 RepID=UPI003DA7D8F8
MGKVISDPSQENHQEAKFSVAIARDILQYVAAQGVDLQDIYRSTKIESAWLEDPDRQISGELLKHLWREAIIKTGDRDLGLHIGEAFDLPAIGLLGYVLLNCKHYGQVLEKLSQYTRLFSQGIAIHHHILDGFVCCDCKIVGGVKNYLLDEPRHPIESTFSALYKATQKLTGKSLQLHDVWFQHNAPSDCSEHERIFQSQVKFSQSINRMIFSADVLNWEVRSANANLLSMFESHASKMLTNLSKDSKFSHKVIKIIVQNLHGEAPPIEMIAHTLMLSVRQLQRELQIENTSYQQILDDTRKEIALKHIQNEQTSIHDLAFLLGFSEPSAFYRAFKRWTGQTPRSYRSA